MLTIIIVFCPILLFATSQNRLKGQASTTIADTAPIVLSTGVLMATPEGGAIEFNGTSLFYTNASNSRKTLTISTDLSSYLALSGSTMTGTITGRASTTIASTAPIKLPTGVLMATPEAGALEFDGTNLYYTNASNARQNLANGTGSQWTTTATSIYYTTGNVWIGTTVPGSALDVKGTVRLSGATSGYVGLAPAAAAGSTTYTLPSADGTSGQVLKTNGSGVLSWVNQTAIGSSFAGANVDTTETTTSTSYVDLATAGPSVTVTTETTAIVNLGVRMFNSAGGSCLISLSVAGAAPTANQIVIWVGSTSTTVGSTFYVSGLTAGSNTFAAKYKVGSGTCTYLNRNLTVVY